MVIYGFHFNTQYLLEMDITNSVPLLMIPSASKETICPIANTLGYIRS